MKPYDVSPLLRRITGIMKGASDIVFSPGHAPMVVVDGHLSDVPIPEMERLSAFQTEMLALSLLRERPSGLSQFLKTGATDISLDLGEMGRYRINIFRQRTNIAVVMRIIPNKLPTFESLGLPEVLRNVTKLRNGIVLITGPTGCGKSSTLAALIQHISSKHHYHIITIEDPIEFIFPRGKSIIHQRELGADTIGFNHALKAALRQAPQVIMVGEMRDRESIEIALEAAETGHLILSTLHTIDAAKTIERILGAFPKDREGFVRARLAQTFRYIVSQRLVPKKNNQGRIAAFEIMSSNERTRNYVLQGSAAAGSLHQAMEDGQPDGMSTFDLSLQELHQTGAISKDTALQYATNPNNLSLKLGVFKDRKPQNSSGTTEFDESETFDRMPLIGLDKGEEDNS